MKTHEFLWLIIYVKSIFVIWNCQNCLFWQFWKFWIFDFSEFVQNFLGHKWTKIKIVVLESTFLTNWFHVKSECFFSVSHCVSWTLTISLKNLWWKCFIFFLTKSRILETFVKMTHRDLCVWKLNQRTITQQ